MRRFRIVPAQEKISRDGAETLVFGLYGLRGFAFGLDGGLLCRIRRHRRVPVEQAVATVAGEQLAFTKLVPRLWPDSHAAAGALHIFNAGKASAAGGAEAVKAHDPLGVDKRPEGLALGGELGLLAGDFCLAKTDAFGCTVENGGKQLDPGAGGGQHGFLGLGAFQAGELLAFQALDFGLGKVELVLDGFGLGGGGEGVLLGAITDKLLAVGGNLAIEATAKRFLAAEGGRSLAGLAFDGSEGSLSFGDFRRQSAGSVGQASSFQLHRLQLYEVFNMLLHPLIEVYGIWRLFRKCELRNPATMGTNWEADLAETRKGFWRRHGWAKWVALGLLAALAASGGLVEVALHRAEPFLRARIVEELGNRFHARVELDNFHVTLAGGLWAEGKGLRIWPPVHAGGVAVPANPESARKPEPMIQLAEFRFHAPLTLKTGKSIHISVVELKGLSIHLPPKSHFEQAAKEGTGSSGASVKSSGGVHLLNLEMDTMECAGADLVMETSKPGKLPLEFRIAHFKLTNLASNQAMGFDAELTNPRPQGTIETTGSIGPFHGADLGDAPLTGEYRFEHADLATFKGIAGILSSTGRYQGTLRDLTVDGETQTPDFRLTHFGNALPLATRFHARVDGTNGDTWLEPVDATLGHSHFTARGQIVRVLVTEAGEAPHSIGHDIALTVDMDRGRMEDLLRLASHSGSVLLTGDVAMKTTLLIPPGPRPVHERMTMNGSFVLDKAQFTNTKIQARIAELSLRGQGRPNALKTTDPMSILSRIQGNFQMVGGVVTLPALNYTVPGAKIELKGTYGLEGGALDFTGSAKLDATVSKMVGGWKGLLLSPADRYFKRDGVGTEIPIRIEGTREEPKFAIDFDRMKRGVKQ